MNDQELEALAAAVTPQQVRQAADAILARQRPPGQRTVPLHYVVDALVDRADTHDQEERWRLWALLREAVIATVQAAPDMSYVPST